MLIIEVESNDMVLSIRLGIGFYGNIWSKTLRAFTAEEGETIIDGVPKHSLTRPKSGFKYSYLLYIIYINVL